jgi:hypothetical protein
LFAVNFLAPVSTSKSHSTSKFSDVFQRRREMSGEISLGSVRKATPESARVVSKMLRRPVTMALPKFWSRKYFCVSLQVISSRLPQLCGVAR